MAQSLSPQVISRLLGEIRVLNRNPPDGIEYVPNEDESSSVTEIHAVITGPEGTPFVNGRFRMKLVISEDYPNSPPKGYFLTKIYHPNIATNGDICVNTLKKDWNSSMTISHVLQVIRCLLIVPFPESSLNDEAGKLIMDSYEEYAARARLMTQVHAMSGSNGASASSSSMQTIKKSGVDNGSNDENSANNGNSSLESEQQDGMENTSANIMNSSNVGSSNSSAMDKNALVKKKEKEIKKKNLKRL